MEKFPSLSSTQYQQYRKRYAINYYEKRLKKIQETMQTMFFYKNDKMFHELVDILNIHFKNKVISAEDQTFRFLNSKKSPETEFYLRETLLCQMREMYNKGFTANKLALPTPTSYMSYIFSWI